MEEYMALIYYTKTQCLPVVIVYPASEICGFNKTLTSLFANT